MENFSLFIKANFTKILKAIVCLGHSDRSLNSMVFKYQD